MSLIYTQYHIISKLIFVCRHSSILIKNVLSQYVFNPFVIANLNKFRSKTVLNKSHNKLHGLILCSIIMVNMIFGWLPHLCAPHIQLSVRSFNRVVNFKHRFNHKDQGGFSMPQRRALIGRHVKKQTLNIPLSMMKLFIQRWMVYQYT
jgi:hypothetical protein